MRDGTIYGALRLDIQGPEQQYCTIANCGFRLLTEVATSQQRPVLVEVRVNSGLEIGIGSALTQLTVNQHRRSSCVNVTN